MKRQNIAQQKKSDNAQRKLSSKQKSVPIACTDSTNISDALELISVEETMDPSSTILEALVRIHGFTASAFDYSTNFQASRT